LYWEHPIIQARNAAWSAALGPRPPYTPDEVRRSRLEGSYRRLEPIVHRAKELVARSIPSHPLAQATLWQCYPTCEIDGKVNRTAALAELGRLAEHLVKPVDPDDLRVHGRRGT
jgi:hypothetical protein